MARPGRQSVAMFTACGHGTDASKKFSAYCRANAMAASLGCDVRLYVLVSFDTLHQGIVKSARQGC